MATGRRYKPRPMPGDDYTDFVLRDVATTGWKVHARITVFAPAQEVLSRIHAAVGVVESVDDHTSVLVTGAESLEIVAVYIGMLGLDFHVDGPPGTRHSTSKPSATATSAPSADTFSTTANRAAPAPCARSVPIAVPSPSHGASAVPASARRRTRSAVLRASQKGGVARFDFFRQAQVARCRGRRCGLG